MHAEASSEISPAEQFERQLAFEADRSWGWIRLLSLLWSLSQCYALMDYALGQVLRVAYGPDAAATTAMIWFFSVPFAFGSGVLSLSAAARLRRRRVLLGALPWAVTTAEATMILWLYFK